MTKLSTFQVFDKAPRCRWDNKEHFPELKTFPHHCHSIDGSVVESPLQGNSVTDLQFILAELNRLFNAEAEPDSKS